MRRTTAIAGVLVALALVALVVDVLANGYGDAKLLIQKAEKAFEAGQDAVALELLDEALYTQTTADKKKEPYGYARYIYYRLSRYWLEQGNSKKAKKYVKKALKAPEDHDWVDEEYWVSAYDPYVTKNFPDLSGMKTKKHPVHKVLPACIGLKNGSGDFIYGIGSKKLYRLNRKTLVSQVLYERSHDYLYRFDVHDSDDKMLLYYEGDKYLYYLETSPFKVRQVPRGTSVDSLYIDRAGTHAVVYKRGGYKFKVVRTSLAEPHDHETLLEQEGRVLISSADELLYATWSYVHGKNFHPYYSPMYEHVMARAFSDAKPQRLFTFPNIDHRNSIDRIESRSGEVEGLFLDDFTRNKQYIIVHDWKGGSTITYEVPYRLNADPCGSYCPLGAAFSHKEDHLVILDIQEKQLRVLRFDFQGTSLTETGVLPLPGGSKLKGKVGKEAIHRLGVLEDNSTVWIHWGDYFVFMDSSGKSSTVDVRPFSKVKSPEWAGPTYYTTDPEQFYLGIEKGKGRYFMVVQLSKLHKP
jgi:hypothetical protein